VLFFFFFVTADNSVNRREITHFLAFGLVGYLVEEITQAPINSSRVYCVCPEQRKSKIRIYLLLALEVFLRLLHTSFRQYIMLLTPDGDKHRIL
jgi:hypothetical protein